MRAGTSRGPFFLRDWLPQDDVSRDETLIGAIGASDLLQLDGVGGGSTLTSKVAIVSRSNEPGCDVDYLFAQVGVGQRSVDTRPTCGNMLAGVAPFAIEQGLIDAKDGVTTVRVFNVNTKSRIDVTVQTPGRRVSYVGETRIDGVAGTGAPIRLSFLDAWGAVTGSVFPTGRRIDVVDGTELTCIDAAMPLMIVRARDLGLSGSESPRSWMRTAAVAAPGGAAGRRRPLWAWRCSPACSKPVLVSEGDSATSLTRAISRPRRATLPRRDRRDRCGHRLRTARHVASADCWIRHPERRRAAPAGAESTWRSNLAGGDDARIQRAALVRTARKILRGVAPSDYVLETHSETSHERLTPPVAAAAAPAVAAWRSIKTITIVVPTAAGGANDAMARTIAQKLGPLLG
jgi:hypothetical protein